MGEVSRLNKTWQRRGLIVMLMVKKAISQFQGLSSQYQFRRLNQNQFQFVHDISASLNYYIANGMVKETTGSQKQIIRIFRSIIVIVKKLMGLIFSKMKCKSIIMAPDSNSLLFLSFIKMILLIVLVIFIPIRISFKDDLHYFDQVFRSAYISCGILLIVLVIISNLFSSFYLKGELISNNSKILRKYLKGDFFLDILIFISYLIGIYWNIPILETSILLKTMQIGQIINKFKQNFDFSEKIILVIDLISLTFKILIIAHLCGCAFYMTHLQEIESGVKITWLSRIDQQLSPWYEQYISSLYWAVVTMVTLGYGDIVPITMLEQLFVICVTLISSGVFGYSINHIGNIFSKLEQKNQEQIKEISLISNFLRQRNIDHSLLMKCRRYLEYLSDENEKSQQCEIILNKLGSDLKTQIKRDIYFKLLMSHQLFSLNFSTSLLETLSDNLSQKQFYPDDIIYRENQQNNLLFFITGGNIILQTSIRVVNVMQQGDLLGQFSFFSNQQEKTTAICKNLVKVACVDRSDFQRIMKKFPGDYEKYCHLRDNLAINQNSKGLDLNCESCQSFEHQFTTCPYIIYRPNQSKFLYQENNFQQIDRKKYQRREDRTSNPLTYIDYSHEAASRLLIDIDYYEDINLLEECIEKIQSVRVSDSQYGKQKLSLLSQEQDVEEDKKYPSSLDSNNVIDDEDHYDIQLVVPETNNLFSTINGAAFNQIVENKNQIAQENHKEKGEELHIYRVGQKQEGRVLYSGRDNEGGNLENPNNFVGKNNGLKHDIPNSPNLRFPTEQINSNKPRNLEIQSPTQIQNSNLNQKNSLDLMVEQSLEFKEKSEQISLSDSISQYTQSQNETTFQNRQSLKRNSRSKFVSIYNSRKRTFEPPVSPIQLNSSAKLVTSNKQQSIHLENDPSKEFLSNQKLDASESVRDGSQNFQDKSKSGEQSLLEKSKGNINSDKQQSYSFPQTLQFFGKSKISLERKFINQIQNNFDIDQQKSWDTYMKNNNLQVVLKNIQMQQKSGQCQSRQPKQQRRKSSIRQQLLSKLKYSTQQRLDGLAHSKLIKTENIDDRKQAFQLNNLTAMDKLQFEMNQENHEYEQQISIYSQRDTPNHLIQADKFQFQSLQLLKQNQVEQF